MHQSPTGLTPAGHATHAVRQLANALKTAGFELPFAKAVLLPDGSAGVELGAFPAAFAARLAEWIEERA